MATNDSANGVPIQPPPPPPPPPAKEEPAPETRKSDPGKRRAIKDDRHGMIVDRRPSEALRHSAIIIA